MTVREVIESFNGKRPRTVNDLLTKCLLPLSFLGAGSFRECYRIVGTNLVVKVPIRGSYLPVNKRHSRLEWDAYQKIQTDAALTELRYLVPKFHYFDPDSGIILATFCKAVKAKDRKAKAQAKRIEKRVSQLMGFDDVDVQANLGLDSKDCLKIIDLGRLIGY